MADEQVSMFCAFTAASPEHAQRFLSLTDGNVEQAVELFFSNPDLGSAAASASNRPAQSSEPITIDDDDNDGEGQQDQARPEAMRSTEDDEAMARRLQEEMYGAGGRQGGGIGDDEDEDGVRAPMARTTETLVGPGSDWRADPDQMQAAIAEQMMARQQQQQRRRVAPGIFNQREAPSIWSQDDSANPDVQREVLSHATGGASEQSSKTNLLANLFRPPFDLITQVPFSVARDEGKQNEKWIIVNVQDPSIFDCQVLNRDIWKNASIRDTIKEHFIFLQYNKDDPRGQEYINYYFSAMRDHEDAYPHIAIVDPRTGEQVKTWSGTPAPKPSDMLMDLHEFLDRYSLRMDTKNPVQTKRKEKQKEVAAMSEEEMMEMAMQNSLTNGGPNVEQDPDLLTRPLDGDAVSGPSTAAGPDEGESSTSNGRDASAPVADTPFSRISASLPHEEPPSSDTEGTTRIQFRYSGGRVVRRFLKTEPVRRIYEWLKAAPFDGKEGVAFELISMGKNLIDSLETSIEDAGLKQGTVMVEFLED